MEPQPPENPPENPPTPAEGTPAESADTKENATAAPAAPPSASLPKKDVEAIHRILHRLTDHKDRDGYEVAKDFQRVVNRRMLPDYFEVIKEPMAFSTIRGKLTKKQYRNYREFIRDFALICHNAQVYNRPSASVYKDAIALRVLFQAELQNLVKEGVITAEDAELPDLGPIPEVEDSPPPDPNDEEVEEDEDEEDEEEEDDETDDDRPRRKGANKKAGGRRSSATAKREGKVDDGGKDDPDSQKKRGRPPKVHTPMEARINTLLKGLRKFKNPGGELKILPFEKLPDKTQMPDYYQEIKQPIAMDLIKRKAKRKKYHSVDQALKDLELMFENAKSYNLESSQIYKDAVDLQKEARIIAEQEKKKPDSDFVDEDGRLPVLEILHNGKVWKVGDWIHLTNPNDVTKPIVAQIYRTWQDPAGQKWINACWYYRPEQTVHRFEKMFFENEVVKTGQYRDHKIEEVVDECFVMFFTRYNKGRPRGFPPNKEVYVCEARYNEEKFKLNKIKTWASCVPDEVREKDYEMDLFDTPRATKKVPSPIKHLLREDAKEDDPLPRPTWGAPNAPPIVGAVHRRPREQNDTPEPEPTPSPPPPEPEPVRRPIMSDRQRYDSQGDVSMSGTSSNAPLPSPSASNVPGQSQYGGQQYSLTRPSASPSPLMHTNSYGSSHGQASHSGVPQTPLYQSLNSAYSQYAPSTTPVAQTPQYTHNHGYPSTAPRPVATPHVSQASNRYNPPNTEIFTLPDQANAAIPADIRSQFHADENGLVLFFTTPPLDANPLPEDKQSLSHSLQYLADKERQKDEESKKRKARELEMVALATEKAKRLKTESEYNKDWLLDQELNTMKSWTSDVDKGTDELYRQLHGENWKEAREQDAARLAAEQKKSSEKQKEVQEFRKQREQRKEVKMTGFKWS